MFDLGSIFVWIKAKTEQFDAAMDGVKTGADQAGKNVEGLRSKANSLATGMVAMGAVGAAGLYSIKVGVDNALDSANKFQSAMIGLTSIARAFGQDADAAKAAANRLAADGLMSVSDAATSLKNLLAAGFSLPQAITLMERFKDSAAFARQGSLSFGDAIRGATEGIKNGNSILVDNAGVTKNLSMMLEEAGYSAQDLMKATSDAGVRGAIYNGILKETNAQLGDASRYADTFAGSQAKANAQMEKTNQALGEALQPVLLKFLQVLTPIIEAIGNFAKQHKTLTAALVVGLAVFFALFAIIGAIGAVVAAVVAAFGSAAAIIIGVVVVAVAALAGAAVWLMLNWDKVKKFFGGMVSAIAGFFSDMWNTITTWVTNVVNAIVGFFSAIPGAVAGFFTDMWNGLVNGLTNMWNSAVELGAMILQAFIDWLIQLPGQVAYWIGFALGWLVGQLIELPGRLVEAGVAILMFFVNLYTSIYTTIFNWIVAAFNFMVDQIVALPGRIVGAGQAIWNFFSNLFSNIYGTVSSWIANTVNNVINWIASLPGKIAGFASALWNTARSLSQTMYDAFIDAVKWLPDRMWEILTSVINKIKDFAGAILNAAKDLGGKIWQGFKDGLGIHSPSYLEKAMMAIEDQGFNTIDQLKKQVGQFAGYADKAKGIAGDFGMGGFAFGLNPITNTSLNAPVGGAVMPVMNVQIDMAGANITSPQVADEYGEAVGDAIIRKLGNSVRL